MRSNVNRLQLSKETLRNLTRDDLAEVVGGRRTNEQSYWLTCGSCDTLCPGGGCADPTIANTCGCVGGSSHC
jgi:hypothetical protein